MVSSARTSIWRFAGVLLAVVVFACLILLGNWQIRRLAEKEALLVSVETRLDQTPLPLATIERMQVDGDDIEFRPVFATGQFEHDKERHFFATFRGQSGYYIYTPLRLDDGRALFVNRGFVPFDDKESVLRPQGQVVGIVTVTGLARDRLEKKPSYIVPENDVAKNIFYWKDIDQMKTSTGMQRDQVVPFFVDADDTPNLGGLPVGGVTRISFPNDHLQYAFTWYGLAAVLAIGVSLLIFRYFRTADDE